MRILALLVVLQMYAVLPAYPQETEPPEGTKITAAQVSGFDLDRLSPGLQEEIGKLVGTPLSRERLRELAARIEAEQPRYIAAIRTLPDPDGARVVFLVARIRDQSPDVDINQKYPVEEVEIRGVPESKLTAEIQSERQALTGKPLDHEAAERLNTLLQAAFPDYDIERRTRRGSQPGQLRVIFDLKRSEASRWLRFEPYTASGVFHSDQGWGAFLPVTMAGRDLLVAPIFAFDQADDLIEEYSGFGFRVDSRRLGTERLGASFEYTNYDLDWRATTVATLAANPQIPGMYRNRSTVTPLARFAITRRLRIGGGVSIGELDALDEDPLTEEPLPEVLPSRMANAFVGYVSFDQEWKQASGPKHDVMATFRVRAGSTSLESDFTYNRYAGSANYLYDWDHHSVLVSGLAGGITGTAPLFERFALGDSQTLRGWDKYDITPAGGNRMFHLSAEYRYRGRLALFLDTGSVWDSGTERKVRVSTGFGFHQGSFFMTVGFPLNTDELRAVFTMGFRAGVRARSH